jgi:hypothetical protein
VNFNFKPSICLSLLLACFIVGCATTPYDYSALEASKPRSIVVIPPKNNTVEVNAPYTFLSTITRPLAEKGYYVFPVSVIDQFFKENGLPGPEEMNQVPLDKISENIGADAVLYVTITDWGQKFQLLASKSIVKSQLKLIDTKTGVVLWEATAHAEQSSGDAGGGLAGALVNAVATQVIGSMVDKTPALSRQASTFAINNTRAGLLNGPYALVEEAK